MSASDNVTRLARRIQKLTGLQYCRARELAEQVRVFIKDPIPDAESPAQRRLEAMVVHALANAFKGRHLNGTLLGVVRASFPVEGLTLHLDPEVGHNVVRHLMLHWDVDRYPVRVVSTEGLITLHSRFGPERIIFVSDDGAPLGFYPQVLLPTERSEILHYPGGPERSPRDLLLSRSLRRPTLINQVAAAHGFANCFIGDAGALVIDWCCGDSLESIVTAMLAHGMVEGLPVTGAAELHRLFQLAAIGGQAVVLRRRFSCVADDSTDLAAPFRAEAAR